MPRRGRVIIPGLPHHIVQRGHNKNAVFIEERDYRYYLDNLLEWTCELNIQVFSYCLMTNHIHLLVQPDDRRDSIGLLMKRLAGRQTRFVNKLEKRTGSLWESRYKVSPVETDTYLLQCSRYIELNPVKAGMVARPSEYEWSSYREKVGLTARSLVDADPAFMGLASIDSQRRERYKQFVEDSYTAEEHQFIQAAVERNQLTGSARFIDEVESRTGSVSNTEAGEGRRKKNKSVTFVSCQ